MDGAWVKSVGEDPRFADVMGDIATSYRLAEPDEARAFMRAEVPGRLDEVNRLVAVPADRCDLFHRLEAVRLTYLEAPLSRRHLLADALAAARMSARRVAEDGDGEVPGRMEAFIDRVYGRDLAIGIVLFDAVDPSRRAGASPGRGGGLRIVGRDASGIVLAGAKHASADTPCAHELLVMPGYDLTEAEPDRAVFCALPVDAPGLTFVTASSCPPAARAVTIQFSNVFVPWDRVFLAGQRRHARFLMHSFAVHHAFSSVAACAGLGGLLAAACAAWSEAPPPEEAVAGLIRAVECSYVCAAAAAGKAREDSVVALPDPDYAILGRVVAERELHEVHRVAHALSGGRIAASPGTEAHFGMARRLDAVLRARQVLSRQRRSAIARLLQGLSVSYEYGWRSSISVGSEAESPAQRREVHRRYSTGPDSSLDTMLRRHGLIEDSGGKRVSRSRQAEAARSFLEASAATDKIFLSV